LAKLSWRPFEEAREFARKLDLKSHAEWMMFRRGSLPEKGMPRQDVPANPDQIYVSKGWVSWGDWLGTGIVAPRLRKYRSFKSARTFARGLGLKNSVEWRKFCRGHLPAKGALPPDIAANPSQSYANKGWIGIGDWLGTGVVAAQLRRYRSFKKARAFVRSLHLRSSSEWKKFCKGELPSKGILPPDIPANAYQVYLGKGWIGMGDWLGTGNIASRSKVYRPFDNARDFARGLGLKNWAEWAEFCRGKMSSKGALPPDIPAGPQQTYAGKGWAGMGDWLGTGIVAPRLRKYRSFASARKFAQSLNLKNQSEWRSLPKDRLPSDIPAAPHLTYADKGWTTWGDWLGTGFVAARLRKYRSFKSARAFARKLGLKNTNQWYDFCSGKLPDKGVLPSDIPANPTVVYSKQGWAGMGDWLGTGNIAFWKKVYRPFKDARAFVRGLRLKSNREWREFCKGAIPEKGALPSDIPSNPNNTYAEKGWSGYCDWLGTCRSRVSKSAKRKS
jgi:hypothetical protein